MGVGDYLNKRLNEKGWGGYLLFKKILLQGDQLSQAYIDRIRKGKVKQVSIAKLNVLARAFGDSPEDWMRAAEYLPVKMSGDIDPGVQEVCRLLQLIPTENRKQIVEAIKSMIKAFLGRE